MTSIGFLHTSPTHVARFDELVAELMPAADVTTVVDAVLLDRARSHGLDDLILIGGAADRIAELAHADVVVCTCSTIGGLAEEIGRAADVDVRRVDRAMAEHAVDAGDRIVVIVAVESTAEPTVDLLNSIAAERGMTPTIEVVAVDGAWDCFESGDVAGYEAEVADAVRSSHGGADVVVLAQASMMAVAERSDLAEVEVPILASPRLAVLALTSPR